MPGMSDVEMDVVATTAGDATPPLDSERSRHSSIISQADSEADQQAEPGEDPSLQAVPGEGFPLQEATVMLRNLPCKYLNEELAAHLDEAGLGGLYNWVYVPSNKHRGRIAGKGYAFVNLRDVSYVDTCRHLLDGKKLGISNSEKLVEVRMATNRSPPAEAFIAVRAGDSQGESGPADLDADRARGSHRVGADVDIGKGTPVDAEDTVFQLTVGDIAAQKGYRVQRDAGSADNGVTVVLHNLPGRCLPQHVVRLLDEAGLADAYSSVSVPVRRRGSRPSNKGYAWVTFKDLTLAYSSQRLLNDKLRGSSKPIVVEVARDQDWAQALAQDQSPLQMLALGPEQEFYSF